jgi:hypothetical protein
MSHRGRWPGTWRVICSSCKEEKESTSFYIRADTQKLRRQCKVCVLIADKIKRARSPEKYKEIYKRHQYKNKEVVLARTREWRKNNLEYDAYRASLYRASKKHATPKWANLDKIKEIYLNCPKGYHVDHVIPLRGKNVSGLHVENNLQYLSAVENLRKRNFYYG